MPLTRDYRETILARARRDPEFRELMFADGVERLLAGDVEVARLTLRDYIEATVGFEGLAALTGRPPESLACMFGKEGSPTAGDLLEVVCTIQRHEGVRLEVHAVR